MGFEVVLQVSAETLVTDTVLMRSKVTNSEVDSNSSSSSITQSGSPASSICCCSYVRIPPLRRHQHLPTLIPFSIGCCVGFSHLKPIKGVVSLPLEIVLCDCNRDHCPNHVEFSPDG